MTLSVLILAAGQGTRMKSALPKVLHPLAGRPLIEHVLLTVDRLKPRNIGLILGHGRALVADTLSKQGWKNFYVIVQAQPKGSGHAVKMATSWLRRQKGSVLVVYGDTPLLTADTLQALCRAHARSKDAATFLAMDVAQPAGYGRMVTAAGQVLLRIVEDQDASPAEKKIRLVNSGVACWDVRKLLAVLPKIRPNNAKREYYLTDAVGLLRQAGHRVGVMTAADWTETHGINTRVDLAEAERMHRRRINERWMKAGVTIVDPQTTYIDDRAKIAPDTRIWPGSVIQGECRIGTHCDIGPYTVVEDAVVGDHVKAGPFARLRPGTVLMAGARVGNFVEIKKSRVGRGSKVNHLTYIGDTVMGEGVNVGAGTITCNYDGYKKSPTVLGNGVFVGSNTNLVAPVKVGAGAFIAAGSTITRDVPANALGMERSKQINRDGWAKAFRNRNKGRAHE